MPVEITLERRVIGFVPATAADQEEAELFPLGAWVKARIVRAKSRPMLRFYWAVIDEVAAGCGIGKEELSHQLLCASRRIDAYQSKRGELFVIPKRISRMDWRELRDYVSAAMDLVFADYAAPESRRQVFAVASAHARTSYEEAVRALELEGEKDGGSGNWQGVAFKKQEQGQRQASKPLGLAHVHRGHPGRQQALPRRLAQHQRGRQLLRHQGVVAGGTRRRGRGATRAQTAAATRRRARAA